jgi:hypothetical protein
VFWFFALGLGLCVLGALPWSDHWITPLAAALVFQLIWDVLFSPLGPTSRLTMAYKFVLLIYVWQSLRPSRH